MSMKSAFLSDSFRRIALAGCYLMLFSRLFLMAAEVPPPASQTPVALVNGEAITDAELTNTAAGQLRQLYLQEYEAKREILENLVNKKLIAAEASRKGLAPDKLLEQEADAKAGEPSDSELKAYYLGQKDRLNRPLADVEQQLRQALRQNRIQEARQEYVKGLRTAANVTLLLRAPRTVVGIDRDRIRGNAKAPVTIVEFSDYQCPYCQAAETTLKQVLAQYQDRVVLAYRDFPLSPIHPQAEIAAEASRCAAERGKFWEYHDALFQNQSLLQKSDLIETARKLGLDGSDFESCLTSGKFRSAVESDYQDGLNAGINGTPAFFVNGIYLTGNQPLSEFARSIDEELELLSSQTEAPALPGGKEVAGKKKP